MSRVTAELVRALVDAQFPHWSGLPLTPVDPGGWDNRSFRLGAELLVRVPSRAAYATQVPIEHRWLPRLAVRLPLAIPEPVALGRPTEQLPWAWLVYRWLDGQPLRDVATVDLTRLANDLGEFLAALHRVGAEDGPPAGPASFGRGGDLSVYAPEVMTAIERLSLSSDVRRLWSNATAEKWVERPVWVHGDIAPGNLLLRDGRLSAVIDWGQACVGDPACDLAFAWTTLDRPARAALRAVLLLDEGTWHRGAGWALWKAAIVAAEMPGTDPAQRPIALATLEALTTDH